MTNINEKLEGISVLRSRIKTLQQSVKILEDEVFRYFGNEIGKQLADKDYGCGTVNIDVNGVKVKITIGKDVSYEQDGLRKVFYQLRDREQNPEEYINVKYDVSEAKYKAWPSDLQKLFEAYRTVKPGKHKMEIEA